MKNPYGYITRNINIISLYVYTRVAARVKNGFRIRLSGVPFKIRDIFRKKKRLSDKSKIYKPFVYFCIRCIVYSRKVGSFELLRST